MCGDASRIHILASGKCLLILYAVYNPAIPAPAIK